MRQSLKAVAYGVGAMGSIRIPDVVNAEPGFVTLDQLPKPRYLHFPLGHYVH